MAISEKDRMECREWIAQNGLDHNTSPAVLLYFEDFLVGVADLTMEERGQYITILCLQNSKGHLTMDQIIRALKPDDPAEYVLAKFKRDGEGRYYNERMEFEIYRRVRRSKTLTANLQGTGKKEEDTGWKTLSPFQANRMKEETQMGAQKEAQKALQHGTQQGRQTGRLSEIETEIEKETEISQSKKNEETGGPIPLWRRRRQEARP